MDAPPGVSPAPATPGLTPGARQPTPGARQGRLRRGLSLAVRVALVLAAVGCGWQLVSTYRELFGEPRAPQKGSAQAEPTPPDALEGARVAQARLLVPGAWSFGDSSWGVQVRETTPAGLKAAAASTGDSAPAGPESALERLVLAFLKQSGQESRAGPFRALLAELRGGHLRGVVERRAGRDRLRLVQLALPGEGTWALVEVRPLASPGRQSGEAGAGLLPLPAGAVLASRHDEGGEVLAQLAGPVHDLPALRRRWREAGWSVEASAGRQPAESPRALSCRREGRGVQVWIFPGPDARGDFLVLLDLPSLSEGGKR